jgi:hypothetical protein
MKSIPVDHGNNQTALEIEQPPYNGYGSVEDSLGSCKYLVLKPPKKDFIKMLENEHKVLRFVARMVGFLNHLAHVDHIFRNPVTRRTPEDVLSSVTDWQMT